MINASKTDTQTQLTFTKADIQAGIIEDLTKQGYTVTGKAWNETNTKFEVTATKPLKK